MRVLMVVVAVVVLAGCKAKKEDDVAETTEIAELPYVREDSSLLLTGGVAEWIDATIQKPAPSRNIQLLQQWKDDSLLVQPFQPSADFYKTYQSVLRWSPDSNYVLDIGSYNAVVKKDAAGRPSIEGGGPDTEIALIEPGAGTRTRLLFTGPSGDVLDARWAGNNQVLIIGLFDRSGNNARDTLAWIIDAREKQFRQYNIKSHP